MESEFHTSLDRLHSLHSVKEWYSSRQKPLAHLDLLQQTAMTSRIMIPIPVGRFKESYTSKVAQLASKVNAMEAKKEACDSAWIQFEDSCYYITTKKTNWQKARSFCVQEGGDLVVVNSEKEQKFLKEKSGVSNLKRFWIGLSDIEEEGTWTWVDGTDYSTSYQFWKKGEPNDHLTNEDCAHLWNPTGEWNDVHCTFQEPYAICEKKVKT
uniref:C-type lectin domain family 4 member E n=1 Tax=Xenopus tropicalis TaxID=8364 RepID=F7CSY8_XENTR